MGTQENLATAKAAYAAFAAADVAGILDAYADDAEIVLRGNSTISGTTRGKEAMLAVLAKLGEQNVKSAPHRYLADGDVVVAFNDVQIGGETVSSVEVLRFNSDAKVTRFENFGTEAVLKRVYGSRALLRR